MATILRSAQTEGGRRLVGGVVEAREAAQRLDQEARATAALIVAAAHEEAKSVLQAAERRGREEGLATTTELRVRAAAERDRWFVEAESRVVALALEVARRVVGEAALRDPQVAVSSAQRVIEAARHRHAIVLRVSPQDHDAVLAAEPRLSRCRGVRVVADATVAAGGAVLESDAGDVIACLESQLDALGQALTERP
jgi:flagellar biosynthesis/type III secretory pathway protein FliH